MSFLVTKLSPPALVAPSEPTPAGELPLTSTDRSRLFLLFTTLLVFDRPIAEPAETIRRALSRALVHYYPVAGRIVGGAGDGCDQQEARLACTGEGVAFAAAAASCTLEGARFLHAPPAIPLADLALRYGGRRRPSDPLLLVQVTEFACGGYVVGVTANHGVADAFGVAQLLRAVGELARGLPSPSVAPVRHDGAFPDIPQLLADVVRRHPAGFKPMDELVYSDVTVPWSFIERVKAEFRGRHGGAARPCTVFEVVAAAVWRCRTRAVNAGAGAPAPLVFTANVRRHVGARDGYYGNCILSVPVAATGGAVASGAVVDLVGLIREAKEQIPETLAGGGSPALEEELVGAMCGYGALYVSTWGGIGMDGVDLGGGGPARVVSSPEQAVAPMCWPCMPCAMNDGEGSNVLALCVTEEHVERFLAELARLQ
ncbi:hypothetical protein ACP4OV_030426 [Aristida adscensionis]